MEEYGNMSFEEWIRLVESTMDGIRELEGLRNLRKNLESGVILRISKDLVRVLMEKDWTNG